ncbi:MAG: chorismate lyase [Pseudomonadota bacterium]
MNLQNAPKSWLNAPGSLTRHLRRACAATLSVDVRTEGWVSAEREVARALRVRLGVKVWRREVVLRCADVPFVHAQSYATRAGGRALGLQRLGGRPLGEILFVRAAYCARRAILRRFSLSGNGKPWRRWALYVVRGHPVLLYEDFLPGLPRSRTVMERCHAGAACTG